MQVLIAQAVIATISVAGGALIALAIDRAKGRRIERRAEVNALRLLVVEIAARRALAPGYSRRALTLDRSDPSSDLETCLRSVRLLRKDIRTARASLRATSPAWSALDDLVAACNVFIEAVDARPADLAVEVEELRERLDSGVHALSAAFPGLLEYRAPGSMAYSGRRG